MFERADCKQKKNKLLSWFNIIILSSIFWLNGVNFAAANELLPQQRHILSRLSFGATSAEIEQINKVGTEAYIQSQLKPQTIEESSVLEKYLAQLNFINKKPIELQKEEIALNRKLRKSNPSAKQERKIRLKVRNLKLQTLNEATDAHLARAIYSNRQLQEVMVEFWFNHFNVDATKKAVRFWVNDYEEQLRTHALGNFADLLLATAQHPAMLMYLDNHTNTDPQSPAGKRSEQGLNENYARELMELHTLGVNGGYSQDDVIALARIFTGWGIDREGKRRGKEDGFFFFPNRHDRQDKTFLGYEIKGSGMEEGKQAIEILASHPATAHFVSYKLAQYFVADIPPESLVDYLTKQFSNSQGDIKIVLDALIHSPEFNDPQYASQKFKTPYQYLVSLVRMGEIEQPEIARVKGMIDQLSMPVFQCSTPNGYADTKSAWLNSQAVLRRTSFATAIAQGVLNRQSLVETQKLGQNLGEISTATKQVIDKTPDRLRTALMMGSPEAMYR